MAVSSATLKLIMEAEDRASRTIGSVTGTLAKLGKTAAIAVVGGVTAASAAILKLANDSSGLPAIAEGFETNMENYGLSAELMRDRLTAASAGTVAQFELMQKANLALTGAGQQLGKEFGQKLPELMEIARAAARNTGQSVDFLFDSIVTGVKRGSPMIIDNLGLVLKVSEANEAYAAKLGKTVDQLTAQEKSIAILNATLEAGKVITDSVDLSQQTLSERIAATRVRLKNLREEAGIRFAPILEKLLEITNPLIESFGIWATDTLPLLSDKITGLLDRIDIDRIIQFGNAFAESGVEGAINDMFGEGTSTKIALFFSDIEQASSGNLAQTATNFEKFWAIVTDTTDEGTGETKKSILEIVGVAIPTIFTGMINTVTGIITAGVQIITGDWEGGMETLETTAQTFGDSILRILGTDLTSMQKSWRDAMTLMGLWVRIKGLEIMAFFGVITNHVKMKAAEWYKIGQDFMWGLWNGFLSVFNPFWNWIVTKWNSLIALTRSIFQMRSPSKVFADIGKNIMLGLEEGIAGNIQGPQLALQSAGTGVIQSGTQVFGGAGGGSRSINIQSVTIADGSDMFKFEAMLKRVLNG